MEKVFVAVDLGADKMVAAAAQKDKEGRVIILGTEEQKTKSGMISKGLIVDPELAAYEFKKLIKQLSYKIGKSISRSYLGIGGVSLVTKLIDSASSLTPGVPVDNSVLEKLRNKVVDAKFEEKLILDVYPQTYKIDGVIVESPLGHTGESISCRYVVSLGKRQIRSGWDNTMASVAIVDPLYKLAPYSIACAALTDEQTDKGVVLIDMGASTTSVIIFKNKALVSQVVIPIGGMHLTQDLMSLNLSFEEAESAKIAYGYMILPEEEASSSVFLSTPTGSQSFSLDSISKVLKARIDELFHVVKQVISESGAIDDYPEGIVLSGGASRLKGMFQYAKSTFNANVTPADQTLQSICTDTPSPICQRQYALLLGLLYLAEADCVEEKVVTPNQFVNETLFDLPAEQPAAPKIVEEKNPVSIAHPKQDKKKNKWIKNISEFTKDLFSE